MPENNRRLGLVAGILLIAVMFATAVWWLWTPSYVALYKDSPEASQAEILAGLTAAGIPFRLNSKDNSIEVSESQVGQARMHLAEAGIPAVGGAGFELFDHADYGMSEFAQRINYQRALEGELGRTIQGMREVRQARVHITLKRTGAFLAAPEQPKASVVIQLTPGSVLSQDQSRGIRELVASAVEGMKPESVVVMNEYGQVLGGADALNQLPDRLQAVSRVEADLREKAESLLRHALGNDGAYVTVHVQMNFDKATAVRERPLPIPGTEEGLVVRQKENHSSTDLGEKEQAAGSEANSQDSSETEYAVGKEHSEIEFATGKLEQISIGVVLSGPVDGISPAQLHELLAGGLGLNTARGDRISVVYAAPGGKTVKSEQATVPPVVAPASQDKALPALLVWAGLGLLMLVGLVAFMLARSGRRSPVSGQQGGPLSQEERQVLLEELRRWLKEPQS
nr:flagellar basal-body MS-ring/collar protein FliF [Fluviicoccus keumensis]